MTEPLAVRVHGLRRVFGDVVAVDDVSLDVRPGEMLTVLGPSGCGKTTVLRLIAGLDRPDAGTIDIGGRRVSGGGASVPPERRRVGMVFQDVALFPHLSVRDNVGYGLRRDPDREVRVREMLDLIDLPDAADRMPHELSGGMQQRVAVARALAPRPDVVLLDEPFSSLDAALRTQLRGDVREILRSAGTAAVFVTHDQDEALTLGDRMAVMVRGRVEQVATPEVVYGEPATPFVATFVGTSNLVHGEYRDGFAVTRFGAARIVGRSRSAPPARGLVVLRPEHLDVREAPDGPADPSAWRVLRRRFTGTEILYEVAAADDARIWVEAGHAVRRLRLGDAVALRMRDIETVMFPSGGGGAQASRDATALAAERPPDLPDALDRLDVERVAEGEDDLTDADPPVAIDEGRDFRG
ncbi:MAG: ABC transporter ATP-binding protein [Chloroflexi bacterium]|nr:ABC transporter ATP-binding protein [Chloroflexota bacterium]